MDQNGVGDVCLLDGGMGMALRHRGLASRTLWAAAALTEAPEEVIPVHEAFIAAFLVNCCSAEVVAGALATLKSLTDRPIGAYPNRMTPVPTDVAIAETAPHPERTDLTPADYAALARTWRVGGAAIIGGCCGVGPAPIAALRAQFPRS